MVTDLLAVDGLLRWQDVVVILADFAIVLGIGVYASRKAKNSEAYFLAGRNMPGWVVGFSLMATVISSMTFLAGPGFAYKENWRYIPCHIGYLLALIVMLFLYMPFFRRGHVSSAYEYLEKRFGYWGRCYAAIGFLLFQMFRMGIILYAVSLPIQSMIGIDLIWIIIIGGLLIASYTIAGGLEAVIWCDLVQGIALMVGGCICLPIIVSKLPGGFGQIISEASAAGKMSLGSMDFNFTEKTMWVMIMMSLFNFLQIGCIDQMTVQRYCAPRSRREARKAIFVGAITSVPVWIYFTFIGTALWVFYKQFPNPDVDNIVPEQILPYFILHEIPAGFAGFVIAGLLAAAMSTMDSSLNASSQTVTTDFYRRLIAPNRDERHYVKVGRWFTFVFAVIMISIALIIHQTRTETLQDLQTVVLCVISGGLAGLFWLGFLTKRTDSTVAIIATIVTVLIVTAWVFFSSSIAHERWPEIARKIPDKFWINSILNTFIFVFGLGLTYVLRRKSKKDLTDLTVWTVSGKAEDN